MAREHPPKGQGSPGPRQLAGPAGPRGTRFGLRLQLLLALGLLVALAFSLLTIASVQLTARSARLEQQATTARMARWLAHRLQTLPPGQRVSPDHVRRMLSQAQVDLALSGLAVHGPHGERTQVGELDERRLVRAPLSDAGELLVSFPPAGAGFDRALRQLLVFYAALTAGAVLLLSFVLLTLLLVRPLENVTRASERLAQGDLSVQAPVAGAAEVAVLAASFNRMAAQLRRDREDLEARFAELQHTTRALSETRDQLVHGEKLASVGRMAAGIAHEIGNPLAAILGFLELLQSGGLPPEQQREFLARIQTETERINAIIRGLLDFSRRDEAEQGPVALAEAVGDALALVRPLKPARGVHFESRVPDDAPTVLGSSAEVVQVLVNLLMNAVDALAGEGRVWLSLSATDTHVSLVVEDDGPGITPELMDRLFEPFTTTKPVGQGTGLGLAVAHGLVERMGGALEAEPRPGGGARFVVRLRRMPSAA